jgi:hypothetical protein
MGGENHNCLLLQITNLRLRYIFHSSIFPQAFANVDFIEMYFCFIQLKYKTVIQKVANDMHFELNVY